MRLYLSNSDYLRNYDRFLASVSLSEPSVLTIASHPKWISVHPAVLTFAAALALRAGKNAIKYVIGELVRNVLEHSRAGSGAIVAAQYYKKSNSVRLGICDNGIGVRRSMSGNWPEKTATHIDALKWALTPGISGTTRREGGTEDNAGAGLFFIKSIAKTTRAYFMIHSGSGIYKLLLADARKKSPPTITADPEKDPHTARDDAPSFEGTLVGIDIQLDATPAFDALLSSIRDVYSATIRERKKLKYKEPRFI